MPLPLEDSGARVWEEGLSINGRSFYPGKRDPRLGEMLHLVRVRDNTHDPNAIAICIGPYLCNQVGWIPMSRTKRLAPLLEDHDGMFKVTRIAAYPLGAVLLKPKHVTEHVTERRPEKSGPPTGWPCPELHSAAGRDIDSYLRHLPDTYLALRTVPHRTSVSVLNQNGSDVGWFRKSEVDGGEDIDWNNVCLKVADGGRRLTIVPTNSYLVGSLTVSNTKIYTDEYGMQHASRSEAYFAAPYGNTQTETPPPKESKMNISATITKTLEMNKSAAADAAYMEAGRIANNGAAKLAGKHLPFMLRGYADTPLGKLVIANIAVMAAAQLRPSDKTLARLTEAMTVEAFQAVYQEVNVEAMIASLLGSDEMKAALNKLPEAPFAPAARPV